MGQQMLNAFTNAFTFSNSQAPLSLLDECELADSSDFALYVGESVSLYERLWILEHRSAIVGLVHAECEYYRISRPVKQKMLSVTGFWTNCVNRLVFIGLTTLSAESRLTETASRMQMSVIALVAHALKTSRELHSLERRSHGCLFVQSTFDEDACRSLHEWEHSPLHVSGSIVAINPLRPLHLF